MESAILKKWVNYLPKDHIIVTLVWYWLHKTCSIDRTFGVYQEETDGSFKIGRSGFKFNNKHVFVDGRKYKATQGLCELLTEANPDRNSVTMQDRQTYKQILIQSNALRVSYRIISYNKFK